MRMPDRTNFQGWQFHMSLTVLSNMLKLPLIKNSQRNEYKME